MRLGILQLASLQSQFVPDAYAHFGWLAVHALMPATQFGGCWNTA